MTEKVVIVGGGQAAVSASLRLRKGGYQGQIEMLCDEPGIPYQRPPLSKKYLKGELTLERLHLRPAGFFDAQQIKLCLGTQALFIDRVNRKVATDGNRKIPYDKLILATGATPRSLPEDIGGKLANVHTFRTLADADHLRGVIRPGQRMLIVGGGYIGLEMAAVAADRGLDVTLIEQQDRILNRVAARETADWFRSLHHRHGVDLREGVGLERLLEKDGRADAAVLDDGSLVGVDLVVAGIGVTANDALARAAGLAVDNGILTDGCCRTFDPDIYAIGDCAVFPFRGQPTRLESVQNACDQGDYVADHILGTAPASYDPQPWFWSDQYDVSLKIAGLNRGYDRIVTRPGDRDGARSIWYFTGDRLLAVDALNDPKAYMMGKRWLAEGQSPDSALLADAGTPLKSVPAFARHPDLQAG